ncbi:meiotic recombination protein REC114 isoform X1 [Protopterus annectens]|uniref:meiotic recombination protein REC114 isoform X1 n=1 Tax=Protopterus annectens TaxID=7888 RepID=UPI001CFAECA9|nr:meiotic recombination protein REC114 isoform X1 [Protopterus annectens]
MTEKSDERLADSSNGKAMGSGNFVGTLCQTQWALKRYARFIAGAATYGSTKTADSCGSSWKVFESDENSGMIILTVVESGHFLISQGPVLLEGFSLIEAHKWMKIVRRLDCLLFGSKIQNESRMFRVQFSGDSKEETVEHCSSCVKQLQHYTSIQITEGNSKEATQSQIQGTSSVSLLRKRSETDVAPEQQKTETSTAEPQEFSQINMTQGLPVRQLAKSMLKECRLPLPTAYQNCSAWNAGDLGPFLHLCLLDQSFPAFVEQVEKELRKLTEE